MKIGIRKPSIKKTIRANTTGKIVRKAKGSINPLYGKKGIGYIKNPEKAIKNSIYHKTTIDSRKVVASVLNDKSTEKTVEAPILKEKKINREQNTKPKRTINKPLKIFLIILLSLFVIVIGFLSLCVMFYLFS